MIIIIKKITMIIRIIMIMIIMIMITTEIMLKIVRHHFSPKHDLRVELVTR